MAVYRVFFTQTPAGELEVIGRAISSIRRSSPAEQQSALQDLFRDALEKARQLTEEFPTAEKRALELSEVADAAARAGLSDLAVSLAEALAGFKQSEPLMFRIDAENNGPSAPPGRTGQRDATVRPRGHTHLLHKLAESFVGAGDITLFKSLLVPCALDLSSAYLMCELLAFAYPEAAHSIVKAVSEAGLE